MVLNIFYYDCWLDWINFNFSYYKHLLSCHEITFILLFCCSWIKVSTFIFLNCKWRALLIYKKVLRWLLYSVSFSVPDFYDQNHPGTTYERLLENVIYYLWEIFIKVISFEFRFILSKSEVGWAVIILG